MANLWEWQGHGGPLAVLLLTLVFALGATLVALWIALPFAVFGIKSALRDLLAAQRETNRLLGKLRRPPAPVPVPPPVSQAPPDVPPDLPRDAA